jgi:serine/threonine protein kinase
MVNDEGEVKLIDFDVALEADEAVKSKVTIVGKQNFLPPEQFRGHPCPQSDIYALRRHSLLSFDSQRTRCPRLLSPTVCH